LGLAASAFYPVHLRESYAESIQYAKHEDPLKEFYSRRLEEISKIEVTLKTVTKAVDPKNPSEPVSYDLTGRGFVVGKYIFTADHIASIYYTYSIQESTLILINRISESTFLDEIALAEVVNDPTNDIAIFDLSKTPELCKRYCNNLTLDDLMTSDKLYTGMRVFWNGNPLLKEGFYRESIISKIVKEVSSFPIGNNSSISIKNAFFTQDAVARGTSGSAIWHYDGHKNYIVGTAVIFWPLLPFPHVFGGIKSMDDYITTIKKYEKDNKKDVKESPELKK